MLDPIGNIPPAEAEARFLAQSRELAMVYGGVTQTNRPPASTARFIPVNWSFEMWWRKKLQSVPGDACAAAAVSARETLKMEAENYINAGRVSTERKLVSLEAYAKGLIFGFVAAIMRQRGTAKIDDGVIYLTPEQQRVHIEAVAEAQQQFCGDRSVHAVFSPLYDALGLEFSKNDLYFRLEASAGRDQEVLDLGVEDAIFQADIASTGMLCPRGRLVEDLFFSRDFDVNGNKPHLDTKNTSTASSENIDIHYLGGYLSNGDEFFRQKHNSDFFRELSVEINKYFAQEYYFDSDNGALLALATRLKSCDTQVKEPLIKVEYMKISSSSLIEAEKAGAEISISDIQEAIGLGFHSLLEEVSYPGLRRGLAKLMVTAGAIQMTMRNTHHIWPKMLNSCTPLIIGFIDKSDNNMQEDINNIQYSISYYLPPGIRSITGSIQDFSRLMQRDYKT